MGRVWERAMAARQEKSVTASRIFAILFLSAFGLSVLLPAIPLSVWTARDAIVQSLAALALVWMIGWGWRESRRDPVRTFTLDIVDVLFLALLGWFTVSAGASRQPFESSVALRTASATLFAWFALRAAFRRWPSLFPVLLGAAYAFGAVAALWILAQTVQARWVAPHAVFTKTNLYALALGVVLAVAAFLLRRTKAGPFLWVAGAIGLAAALTWGLRLEQREGPFPNVNIAAGFLGILLVAGVFRRPKGAAFQVLLAVLFLAWSVTQSRGAFLSMTAVGAAVALLHRGAIEERLAAWDRRRWLLAGLATLAVLLALVPMVTRFFNAFEMDPRSYWRVHVWESAVRMALQAPLLGYGPGTFGDVYPYFRSAAVWAAQNPFAHSEYLQVAAECGAPALAGLILLLGVAALNLARRAAKSREAEAALWSLALVAIHNAVDFTFHEWSLRLLLILLVAYALREPATGELDLSLHLSRRGSATLAVAVAALVLLQGGWFSARDYFARLYYARGVARQNAGDLDGAESLLRRSLAFRSDFMGPWNSLGALELSRAESKGSRSDALPHLRRAKENLERAMAVDAYSLTPRENYVAYLLKTGNLAEAYAYQSGLTAGMPAYPPHRLAEARILLMMGRPRDAVRTLDAALKVDAYYVPVRLLRATALERAGDREGARREYLEIRRIADELGIRDNEGVLEGHLRRLEAPAR